MNTNNHNILETLIGIFTVEKSEIKILLLRKKNEPYKGYWVLPGDIVKKDETLEQTVNNFVSNKIGLPNIYIEQSHIFSDVNRMPNERIIASTFVGLINSITLYLKSEKVEVDYEWFNINQIPKTAYDHDKIIASLINDMKKKIVNSNILKVLFPSDFTLPELKHIYEQILGLDLDRRNFRKKLINLGYIEDTGDINEGSTGRPAKLYRFKDDLKERNLF